MAASRRDFLKIAGMLTGVGFVPDSIRRAFAIDPDPGSTYIDAEHIVILMQENRSFDHAFGTLQGVRGFNDPRAIRHANGNSIFVQTDASGNSYAPWRLDIKDTRSTWMKDLPHSRNSQVDAWNEGHHDKWLEAKRSAHAEYANLPLTMGYYTREDIPFYYALADAFTVCDQNYCSVMTSTSPNRCIFWTGTVRDEQHVNSRVFMRNDEILCGGMTWKTYPERLHEAGITWKFYQNELSNSGGLSKEEGAWLSNFECNILEYFSAYNVEAHASVALGLQQQIASLTQQAEKTGHDLSIEKDPQVISHLQARLTSEQKQIARLKVALANSGDERYRKLTNSQRRLLDAAFVTNTGDPHYRSLATLSFDDDGKQEQMKVPKGDIFYQFRRDVNEGKLPTISWLTAPEKFSDHPTSPWYGAWYISEVMDILTKNPEVWKKTIFILTYDENDGYFDHAPSFVAADPKRPRTGGASSGIDTGLEYSYVPDELQQGVEKEDARSGPIGMGFRVPLIVASPWTRGGWVNSQLFDHSSTLMFLEDFLQKKFGKTVREENISAWRRSISGNLTSCFRPNDAKEPKLDFLNRDKFVVGIERARNKPIPSAYKKMTAAQIEEINTKPSHSPNTAHQEEGMRPSCSLPYELYAEGGLSSDGTKFELRMKAGSEAHGIRSAGAPFNVYLRNTTSAVSPKKMAVATYAVRAGDMLTQEFPLTLFAQGRYSIDVHGPNGFYRSFSGDAHASALQTRVSYEGHGSQLTGNVEVHLRNSSESPVTVAIQDNSYKTGTIKKTIAASQEASVVLPLQQSHGWYDFTVQSDSSSAEASFAGRVETGRSTFNDPLMGRVV